MKRRTEVVLAGLGGQGLILIGKILGEAAAIYEGKNSVQTQSYGVASRGGFSKSEVVISSEEIAYPEVLDPDVVLTLSQQAYDLYKNKVRKDCWLIYDSDTITGEGVSDKEFGFPITTVAVELRNTRILNMIALGILVKLTGIVSVESILRSLEKNIPSQFRDVNLRAFQRGLEMS
ncbi:2-oxoacid:acceptor oxidoreductase family protein [Thermosediminibacter litoriperuensis]|uniref:2-oxoglutarate ferredoxin oxidoreductase subunit gamma n=1 Tax=Thermosediminibacter litoriperuensis TaxID=291989 RepID=A0A5S5AYS1_9FIRM|nr:2-oxoacid:acceptor oxidoreductase family protein [Thermosediminibacter litoriperuensis]TYP59857.1 2-oxoglutarate ferredoxin oxidoreductase subunit gamma [Thermosediminibacter litoriperuensis]